MARHHHDSDPLVIPMEDGLIHTDEHPFCSIDSTCPCHDDPVRIAAVAEAVVRGELTPATLSPVSWSKGGRQQMSTILQQATAFTPAPAPPSPSSPLLWIPLDEVRLAWASFGAEALSCPALLATATAFRALCWETSALRYYGMACQAQQRGGLFQQAAASWLDLVVLDLGEAVRDWRSVQLWLERPAASSDTRQACIEPLELVGALSEQVATQQERLHHLLGQVRQEQSACRRDGQATAPVTPRAATPSVAAGVAAAARAPEEESETWTGA